MLRDLPSKSWQWFDTVYEVALEYYELFQKSDPLQRGQLKPDLPQDLRNPTFARLESRAVQMLLQSFPESVVSQATATRTLSSVGLLYQVLKQYQLPAWWPPRKGRTVLTELNGSGGARSSASTARLV